MVREKHQEIVYRLSILCLKQKHEEALALLLVILGDKIVRKEATHIRGSKRVWCVSYFTDEGTVATHWPNSRTHAVHLVMSNIGRALDKLEV